MKEKSSFNLVWVKEFILEQNPKEAYSRIPESLVLFFTILQRTTLFFVETYLDMDNHEGQSSFDMVWLKEFILKQNPKL